MPDKKFRYAQMTQGGLKVGQVAAVDLLEASSIVDLIVTPEAPLIIMVDANFALNDFKMMDALRAIANYQEPDNTDE